MSDNIKSFGMRPSHPGVFIKTDVLEPLGLSVKKASEILKVRRATLSDLLNGRSGLTPQMALRIEKAFDIKMDFLLRMQANYDAFMMRMKKEELNISRYEPVT